jgi:hypothetical protein
MYLRKIFILLAFITNYGQGSILFALVYTLLKRYKGEIGESTIIYYI